ncbi:MAG: hypothetical protein ACK5Q5_14430 [Planctomycetaceae bacterium]
MSIELTNTAKELAALEVQNGRFRSVEEFIEAAVQQYAVGASAITEDHRRVSWLAFDSAYDLAAIAAEQGVGPAENADSLRFADWPEEDSVEDFIARARGEESEPTRP